MVCAIFVKSTLFGCGACRPHRKTWWNEKVDMLHPKLYVFKWEDVPKRRSVLCRCLVWCSDSIGHRILRFVTQNNQFRHFYHLQIHDAIVCTSLCLSVATRKVFLIFLLHCDGWCGFSPSFKLSGIMVVITAGYLLLKYKAFDFFEGSRFSLIGLSFVVSASCLDGFVRTLSQILLQPNGQLSTQTFQEPQPCLKWLLGYSQGPLEMLEKVSPSKLCSWMF